MSAIATPPKFRTLADILKHLGGIPADRVLFQPYPGTATRSDLLANPDETKCCELIDGTLVSKPTGSRENLFNCLLIHLIVGFVRGRNLGWVYSEPTTFELPNGVILGPDLSVALWPRFPGARIPTDPVLQLVPNLAVEVLSPSNTAAEMLRKRREYFGAGVEIVWEIEPDLRIVNVFTDANAYTTYTRNDTLPGDPVLPGFTLALGDLFGQLDATP